MVLPVVDFQTLIEELRNRFAGQQKYSGASGDEVTEAVRCRLAGLLDAAPDASMPEIIEMLAVKWHKDGLI